MRKTAAFLILLVAVTAAPESKFQYPETKKVDQKDTYAENVVVADPYRWLENDVRESPDVKAWVDVQNEVTFRYLRSLPQRETIKKQLTRLWDYEKYTLPSKYAGRYFFRKNDGLQSQSVLYVTGDLSEKPRVLIDPNSWSKDGTTALTSYSPSEDGRYLAYGVAEAGSDWNTWRVLEVESGKVLSDELRWVKFSSARWTHDTRRSLSSTRMNRSKSSASSAIGVRGTVLRKGSRSRQSSRSRDQKNRDQLPASRRVLSIAQRREQLFENLRPSADRTDVQFSGADLRLHRCQHAVFRGR